MTEPGGRLRVMLVEPGHALLQVIATDPELEPVRCSVSGDAVAAVARFAPMSAGPRRWG